MKVRRLSFFIVWLAFILYAFVLAPNGNQGYLNQLITMNDPDPLLLTVFSLLGVFPTAFAILLLNEDDSRVPAWPFVLGSFMLGAFALMPYFFISRAESTRTLRTPIWIGKSLDSILFKALLFTGTVALIVSGLTQGSASLYGQAFRQSQFVHVMTIDFLVLTGISMFVIYWRERKHGRFNQMYWLGCVPVVGFLAYLLIKEGSH
ncbi:hypothetical protein H0266_09750 [Halobacillus locisalis]|uniref:DUF2834 domain-containing protein n=1 Tax=Halobacillus locisalis TaxID=220753 RepID=A0A838CU68_9BACI|nr:hypothetical protein [Halobacillus locisalis]